MFINKEIIVLRKLIVTSLVVFVLRVFVFYRIVSCQPDQIVDLYYRMFTSVAIDLPIWLNVFVADFIPFLCVAYGVVLIALYFFQYKARGTFITIVVLLILSLLLPYHSCGFYNGFIIFLFSAQRMLDGVIICYFTIKDSCLPFSKIPYVPDWLAKHNKRPSSEMKSYLVVIGSITILIIASIGLIVRLGIIEHDMAPEAFRALQKHYIGELFRQAPLLP